MGANNDEIQLIAAPTAGSTAPKTLEPAPKKCNVGKSKESPGKAAGKPADAHMRATAEPATTGTAPRIDEDAEERQRTGRYLAVGVTLVMVFIAFYHTLLRHTTVLAGLVAPAIIMLLYILWLLYFAKKRKRQYVGQRRTRRLRAQDVGSSVGRKAHGPWPPRSVAGPRKV